MPLRSIRSALVLAGVGLLLLVGVAIASADTEPNDDSSSAEAIVAATYVGSLNVTDRTDVYKLEVVGSDIVGLSFRTLTSGTQYLDVRDCDNRTWSTLESRGGARSTVNVYVGCEVDMEWWFLVVSVGPTGQESPGEYEFSLFYDQQDDGGTECDAPCDFENALMLDAGDHPGEYGFHDTRDVYRVVVKAGWTLGLCLDCTEQAGPMRVRVYTGDDLTTPMKDMEVMDERSCEWLLPAATPIGTNWYVVLEGVSNDTYGEYSLRVDMEETDSGPPRVTNVAPKRFTPGEDLKVRVTIDEDTEIATATLFYRKGGKGAFKQSPLTLEGDVYTCRIGKKDLAGAKEMEYYIEATDTTGFSGSLGSETDVETMGSAGESPGFGFATLVLSLVVSVHLLGGRRRG